MMDDLRVADLKVAGGSVYLLISFYNLFLYQLHQITIHQITHQPIPAFKFVFNYLLSAAWPGLPVLIRRGG